jgi:hypothetical protein
MGIAESEYNEWNNDRKYLAHPKAKPRSASITKPDWNKAKISNIIRLTFFIISPLKKL